MVFRQDQNVSVRNCIWLLRIKKSVFCVAFSVQLVYTHRVGMFGLWGKDALLSWYHLSSLELVIVFHYCYSCFLIKCLN